LFHQLHGASQAVRPAGREAGCLDPPAAPALAAAPGCAARSAGGGWQGVREGGNGRAMGCWGVVKSKPRKSEGF